MALATCTGTFFRSMQASSVVQSQRASTRVVARRLQGAPVLQSTKRPAPLLAASSSRGSSSCSRAARLRCQAGLIEKINGEQLEVAVQSRDKPLIIDFFATWCGPCVLMSQELEKIAAEYGDKLRIVKIDTDEEPDLSTQLMIQGLPTLVFIGTGDKPALRTEGLLPAETIKQIVEEELLA